MKRISSGGLLTKDLIYVILCSLIATLILVLFYFKHSGLSGDSIYYIDEAENTAHGQWFMIRIADYLSYPLLKPVDISMPLYPFLVSLLIRIGMEPTLSARLVPIIFLAMIPFPMFYLAKIMYGRAIAYASTIVLILLWAIVYVGSFTWTETAFIFFVLLSMLYLAKLMTSLDVSDSIRGKKDSFLSGITIGLAYLTKGHGFFLLPVAFYVIFFLLPLSKNMIKHKAILFLFLILGFSIVSSPWWIRNYLIFGFPLHHGLLDINILQLPNVETLLRLVWVFGGGLFPIILYLSYSPMYLFEQSQRNKVLFFASFPGIMILFFTVWPDVVHRLLSPAFPFLIIIGVKTLFDMVGKIRDKCEIFKRYSLRQIEIILIIITILPQIVFISSYYIFHTPNILDLNSSWGKPWALERMSTYGSIYWINMNTNQNDNILSNDYDGVYHYTRRNIVWSGGSPNKFLVYLGPYGQLDYKGLIYAIDQLNVSYIVLFRKSIVTGFRDQITCEYDGCFTYELSRGSGAPPNMKIVYDKEDAIIYEVEK